MRPVLGSFTSAAFVGILLFSSGWPTAPARDNKAELRFDAKSQKAQYAAGEKVEFVFSIRNAGERDVLVARPFVLNHYVWLRVLDAEGKHVPWCGKINGRLESPDEFVILRPGAAVESTVTISCDDRKDSGYLLNEPGKYRVFAHYYLPIPKKSLERIAGQAAVVKARIRARPVEVVIGNSGEVPPRGPL